jgi:hypothetical protein
VDLTPSALLAADQRWRRTQLRRAALLVCTPGIAVGALTLTTAYALGVFDRQPTPTPVSLVAGQSRPAFELHVLNGSGRQGLAGGAAKALRTAGFTVTVVGNAPEGQWHDHSAVIRFGPRGMAGARLVATEIPASRLVQDERTGTGVDIVLGTTFTAIAAGQPRH